MPKQYIDVDVLTAARRRTSLIFDEFDTIVVSYSGGKDSSVLLDLARREAERRGRKVHALFIDLEAQYQATIDQVRAMMLNDPVIKPIWVCLPLNLRNAVSVFQPHWACWDPEEREHWVRPMPEGDYVLNDPDMLSFFRYRMEFEEFIVKFPQWWMENRNSGKYASLVAIRADESLNRYMAVSKSSAKARGGKKSAYHTVSGQIIRWGTKQDNNSDQIVAFYPIYDWRVEDVWRYHHDAGIPHNEIYDKMYLAGVPLSEQRICQPYGDDQRKGLDLWAKVEPETWRKVLNRVVGVNYGARYAGQKLLGYHRGLGLPEGHTWKSYTFLLLSTLPDVMRERYLSNFAVFLEWWMRHGYPNLDEVHDDEIEAAKHSDRRRLPSWRRLALCILKNDFNGKSLSIGSVKDVYTDVYERVQNGEPVRVRKSVKPIYRYLREQYAAYLRGGIEAVDLEFYLPEHPLKQKYKDL
jgi:predicted phosphoadenosine phosphosulfate sulfurtransferase